MAKSHESYERLENENDSDEDDIREHVIGGLRNSKVRRVHIRRKLRIKLPRFKIGLGRKRSLIKIAWTKLFARLKECHSQFGDIFAGNYLFLQVNPTLFNSKSVGVCDGNVGVSVKDS